MIVVYISNRYIHVVDGGVSNNKIQVKNLCVTKDTNGCVLNGVLTDPEGFSNLIEKMWENNNLPKKGVKLVIDSNQFNTKLINLPKQKPKQMMTFVSREFTDIGRMEDPIYGYFPMQMSSHLSEQTIEETETETTEADTKKQKKGKVKKEKKSKEKKTKNLKMVQVFATAVSREQAKGYVELFEDLGISICSIESARGAAIQLAERLNCVKNRTCIVQFVDDMVLINMLFDRGTYVYASRTRMFSEVGTVDFAVEAARTVNNILQFAQAQKLPEPVENVFIAGIDPDIMSVYQDSIQRINMDLQAEWLSCKGDIEFPSNVDADRSFSDYAVAIGALGKESGKTDLIVQMRQDPEAMQKRAKKKKVLIPVCTLAGVMAVATIVAGGRVLVLQKQLNDVKAYTQDESNKNLCSQYDQTYSRMNEITSQIGNMTSLEKSVLRYPKVDASINDQLQQCASGLVDVDITGYDAEKGTLSFSSSAANAEKIHQFIVTLNQQKMFAVVDYTGYTQDSDGKWNVNVYCTMAARQEGE